MNSDLGWAVLATLIYADIFGYPLNQTEIKKFLIRQKVTNRELKSTLYKLRIQKKIEQKDQYYFLAKRGKLVKLRKKRMLYSKPKMLKAQKIASILKLIPWICLVGISGGLAMRNTDFDDDIDFFIISSPNRIWTTRFFSTLLLTILRQRRLFKVKKIKDKICLNMFVDASDLEIKPHDLYLAHEVLQMIPIGDRNSMYDKFINKNLWAFNYLPNWKLNFKKELFGNENPSSSLLFSKVGNKSEAFFRNLQLIYMKQKRTTEKITSTKIQFHPQDVRNLVLSNYKQKLKSLK